MYVSMYIYIKHVVTVRKKAVNFKESKDGCVFGRLVRESL